MKQCSLVPRPKVFICVYSKGSKRHPDQDVVSDQQIRLTYWGTARLKKKTIS